MYLFTNFKEIVDMKALFNTVLSRKRGYKSVREYAFPLNKKNKTKITLDDFSEEERKLYQANVIDISRNPRAIHAALELGIVLSKMDFEYLKKIFIESGYGACIVIGKDKIVKRLHLKKEEIQKCITVYLRHSFNMSTLVENYLEYMTTIHKKILLDYLYKNWESAASIIFAKHVPENFRMLVLQASNPKNYRLIFSKIESYDSTTSFARAFLFNTLFQNETFEYFEPILQFLNIDEKLKIYNKYHEELFSNKKKYTQFYDRCIIFGKFIGKEERMTLVKRLSTKTRYLDIPHARKNIEFDEEERMKLNSISLFYNLKEGCNG